MNKCLAAHLPQKVEIASMGVDLSRFHRKTPYSAWNGSDACHIFSCGRLNRCKGHADLIAAIDILRKEDLMLSCKLLEKTDRVAVATARN